VAASAPIPRAKSRRCARGSTAQIRPAWAARNAAIVKSPIGPAPMTATVSPGLIDARRRECMAIARGSARVASLNDIPVGMGRKLATGKFDQFPEKARMMRVAQKAYVRADVVVPAQTGLAVIAIKCGLKRPAVARSESSDTRA